MGGLAVAPSRRASRRTDGVVVRYGAAVLSVVVSYALQRALWRHIPPSPHLLFYPAVFVAGRLGGAGPGYLATCLASVGIAYGFLAPEGLFAVAESGDALDLAIFVGVGVGISAALGRLRAAVEREHLEALAARAAKRSTDATWSMVAHDLCQPLSVISMGSSELGRRGGAAMAPDVERILRLIQRSTERARDLVDDALDAMRIAEGKLVIAAARCEVDALCARSLDGIALLASHKGVTLASESVRGRAVIGDARRLEQVLTNLLGNAVKFTPARGRVSLAVTEVDAGLEFSVRDTGPGIAAQDMEAVFAKFWSGTAGGGNGLGLWIACAIVEAHGSRLTVVSREGEGTTFSFVLPMAAHVAIGAPSERRDAPGAARTARN